ncbi:Uncharacterised protein [Campylobacter hyointestinalis subsp. hyointestinalis]|uniref:Uncharacterized protein n=1 Tax=Campylobacter hyointestinalis subsp. hyointestinalis TaxID=91352 RepID=A0A9W5AW59_CAMHY|nr:Uncharacterised protein [Campylobacter hyointestinalis subsp. hyointestinalis]
MNTELFYYELVPTDICTSEKGRMLLPTPIKSDAFVMKRFSMKSQMLTFKNHQERLYPYIIDAFGEKQTDMKMICEIYEKMMGFARTWSE